MQPCGKFSNGLEDLFHVRSVKGFRRWELRKHLSDGDLAGFVLRGLRLELTCADCRVVEHELGELGGER